MTRKGEITRSDLHRQWPAYLLWIYALRTPANR